eukprot:TRINITY_DN38183_c0_g1_i4.p1 TRINITY_DN38183_c0_g1~~TRINITY_DN38183_c0_g1_i4.p1  ORF type:complete len:173 (+),score=33.80 TRINITY_DN38183_c0_g1_i4:197-715(+)
MTAVSNTSPSTQVTLPHGTLSLAATVRMAAPEPNTSLGRTSSGLERQEQTQRIRNIVLEGKMVGASGIPGCPVEKLQQGGQKLGVFKREVEQTLVVLHSHAHDHSELCQILLADWQPAVTDYLGWLQANYLDQVVAEDLRPERKRLNVLAAEMESHLTGCIAKLEATKVMKP